MKMFVIDISSERLTEFMRTHGNIAAGKNILFSIGILNFGTPKVVFLETIISVLV